MDINTNTVFQCSVTCGTGVQTRLVRCILEGVSNSNCEDVAKPSGHQQCSLDPCKKDPPSSSKPPKSKLFGPYVFHSVRIATCGNESINCWLFQKLTRRRRSASTNIQIVRWSSRTVCAASSTTSIRAVGVVNSRSAARTNHRFRQVHPTMVAAVLCSIKLVAFLP